MGDVSTTWGAVRASMGHPDPFPINYAAIGNEDTGFPTYLNNYLEFYGAIKAVYPNITLIANGNLEGQAPTDLWDYHVYTSPDWFWDNQFMWDAMPRATTPPVFNSEYAATGYAGTGNLNASIGEAVWMTGLERNSDLVVMASYAPLFVNDNARGWNPDAIVFDSSSVYGTPSYWTQVLFSNHAGLISLPSQLGSSSNDSLGFSATCADMECSQLYLKMVNFANAPNTVQLSLENAPVTVQPQGTIITITSASVADENSFATPNLIVPVTSSLANLANTCSIALDANSINVVILQAVPQTAAAAAAAAAATF